MAEMTLWGFDGSTYVRTVKNDVLPGKALVPADPKDRARMDMTMGLVDSYGYGAMVGGIAAYHLFPDFVGGKNDAIREEGIENARKLVELLMKIRGDSPFIAGDLSLADLYLAPIVSYVSMTPDMGSLIGIAGFGDWWEAVQALGSYKSTQS